jgi:4-hydroxy-tetrahydrodipicolinate reductase
MYVGAEEPRDRVEITGTPDVSVEVEGGYHGDVATPAVVVNAASQLPDVEAGLRTMLDLRHPSYATE